MKRNYFAFILAIAFIVAITLWLYEAISSKNLHGWSRNGKLRVAVSFYPLYYFASEIAGDKADFMTITPPSAEPHDYEPTARDVARIEDSQMLILNGGNFEAWGYKIKNDSQGKNILVVVAGDGLLDKNFTEDGQRITDPHIWLDPILAKQEVQNIEKGFEQLDPANAAYYQANEQMLKGKLDALDREYAKGLESCKLKEIVTSHAAFGYLTARYNVNQVAISGVSPDEEPSSQAIAMIADLVRKEGIKVVFFEILVSPKLSQTIASETGAKTMVLDPIEGIPEAARKRGADYLSVMKQNLDNLKIALQCKAP